MAGSPRNSRTPKTSRASHAKQIGGGTAVGGGVNFQAVVTAIVGVHILRGTALGWCDGICNDRPVAVWAESEGPGDDLRIELHDDEALEVQAKKGLKKGKKLWDALLSIARAIDKGELAYGALVVASDSSRTIYGELAVDIERIGDGRTDCLRSMGKDWLAALQAEKLSSLKVCRSLRIRVVHALRAEDSDVKAAKEILRHVCAREEDVEAAWNTLYRHAVLLIEARGRWSLSNLVRLFRSQDIAIRANDFPASLLERHSRWVAKLNAQFCITGFRREIPIDQLIPIKLEHMAEWESPVADRAAAVMRYHAKAQYPRYDKVYDSVWTGRFKKRAVVVAGPGLGKSTMLKELAHQYAMDGFTVLSASLRYIAAGMKHGGSFQDLLMQHSLDGFDFPAEKFKNTTQLNLVLLLDGLDECGPAHPNVASHIARFAEGHRLARIIVTSRPVGYETAALSSWEHYRLLPPIVANGSKNLAILASALRSDESTVGDDAARLVNQTEKLPSDAIAISPQLLGMAAVLVHRHRALPRTRFKLYVELMKLFEDKLLALDPEQADVAISALEIIAWELVKDPLVAFDELVDRTAASLAPLIGTTKLAATKPVRLAIDHWEKIGLVERIYHHSTVLLTFIHKTFSEFVASRHISKSTSALSDDLIDRPDMQEVLNFALAQGCAEHFITIYLRRHDAGMNGQLSLALGCLRSDEFSVTRPTVKDLVKKSFDAIEIDVTDRFDVGLAIADTEKNSFPDVHAEALTRLRSPNRTTRLVAWATVLTRDPAPFDAATLAAVLEDLLSSEKAANPRQLLGGYRSERELLSRVAIAALKAQPDESLRSFALQILERPNLGARLRLEVDLILIARGFEELPDKLDVTRRSSIVGFPFTQAVNGIPPLLVNALNSIAGAFVTEESSPISSVKPRKGYPQFSALLHASRYLTLSTFDLTYPASAENDARFRSTLRAVAHAIPLDLDELSQESNDLLQRLQKSTPRSIFDILSNVDVPEPAWPKISELRDTRNEMKQALFHPSPFICFVALVACVSFPLSSAELDELLRITSGDSLKKVVTLTSLLYPQRLEILTDRIHSSSSAEVTQILAGLDGLDIDPPSELVNTILGRMRADDIDVCESAALLFRDWFDRDLSMDKLLIKDTLIRKLGGGKVEGAASFSKSLADLLACVG